ncbi:MAG: sulfurtransferase [Alteromonadaceae bacterium]|nr:MAG: sulfurtransferase [Alteromonadaceae bacterium]
MNIKSITYAVTLAIGVLFFSTSYADPVWIDVRSLPENKIDSIKGDIRITHTDIVAEISKIYPDKNTEIRLYCRSGGRAGKALLALKKAGYNNVQNVGGIDDARKVRN